MSVLAPEVTAALGQLVVGLQSTDNPTRTAAEEQLNKTWKTEQPDALLMGLGEQIHMSTDNGTRSFAAVLFRKISTSPRKIAATENKELFLTLAQGQQEAIRQILLTCLTKETVSPVRHKIGDAVAELARQYTEAEAPWPEVLGALFQLSQSGEEGQRETAFRIFATTPGIIEKQHEEAVQVVFTKGFKDSEANVRIAAMEAFASFFRAINKKSQKKYYNSVADILNILPPLKETGDSDNLSKALVALIELAEVAPTMFKALFNNLVQFSISVIQDKELDDQARQNALELMATFADYAAPMCKRDPSYTNDMVTQCLSLMTDIGQDDDNAEEWNASEDLDAEESDLNHVAGEQTMDRLANKLGGDSLLAPTFQWLPRMMQSTSWRDRHAALMAISAISEGCYDGMRAELEQVLALVIPALKDSHPRVRWAGCNALGQMSTDFAGIMQEKFHQTVLENIIPVLQAPEPRVQAHAAAALVNFCEEAEKEVLAPYLPSLLNNLMALLQSPKRFVQEQALSTIATIADSAEAAFGQYYDNLMPLLFGVLQSEQEKEYRLLRAKAMECATLIALAVGKERMGGDALKLVQILGGVQQVVSDPDDPQAQYLLHCWGRMCKILGTDFIPYLPSVMPPLLELASAKADITLLEDDEQISTYEQEEGWELVPLKGKVIGIKTSLLEDKHMAIELIVIYAQQLQDAFEPYVVQIIQTISIPGLAFFFHDPVRIAAAKSVPYLLSAYKKRHGVESDEMRKLWAFTVDKLIEVLAPEVSIDTLAEMYQCFYESVEVMGKDSLTTAHMNAFIENARETLREYQQRVQQRIEDRGEADEGETETDDELMAIEEDQALLSDMNKAFHTIFKHHGVSFIPTWSQLLQVYQTFVISEDHTQRQWALCIFDDVLEFTGDHSWDFQQYIREPLAAGLRDPVPANRQAACYGVGIAAHRGGSSWLPFCVECLPTLFQVCQIPNAREGDDVYATENSSAAIAKILMPTGESLPNYQDMVSAWIPTLPIVNDDEAAPFAYGFLGKLIQEHNPVVLSNGANAFVSILKALEADTLQGNNAAKAVAAAKALAQAAGLDAQSLLQGSLTQDGQARVMAWFS